MKDGTTDLQGAQAILDASLHTARQKQFAHQAAVASIKDAQTLRLQTLHDELAPIVQARPQTSDFIELALVQGDPPKLWLDLTGFVTMAPDPRTYRLVQDTRDGPHTLLETTNRAEMREKVTEFIAHRTVARQRELPSMSADLPVNQGRYSTAALVLAWLTGLSFGVLAFYVVKVLSS